MIDMFGFWSMMAFSLILTIGFLYEWKTSHLHLGHPWQFDWKMIHNGFRNRFTIVKNGKTITFVHLSPKQVYDDQMKLKRDCDDWKSENSREDISERRLSNLAKSKSLIKLVESGVKTRGVKKVRLCNDNIVEELKKQPNFYAKKLKSDMRFSLTS